MRKIRVYMVMYFSRATVAAALACMLFACRSTPETRESQFEGFSAEIEALEQSLSAQEDPAPGVLRFTLAFGAEADLDLFVTGPRFESVYFANTPSAVGGALEVDIRCGSTATRIETIRYPEPPPGPYRVGIDFPRRCDAGDAAVPFAVRVQRGPGSPLASETGVIRPGEFLTIVLETRLP